MGSPWMEHGLYGQYKHNSTQISVKFEIALNMDRLNAKVNPTPIYARQEGPYSSKPMTVWILVQSKEQAKPRANESDINVFTTY